MIDELEQAGPRHELTLAERAYLEALFKESYRKLYSVAYRHLAGVCMDSVEDVIQETFLRACTNFHKMIQFDSPEAWLVEVPPLLALSLPEVSPLSPPQPASRERAMTMDRPRQVSFFILNCSFCSDFDVFGFSDYGAKYKKEM